MTLESGDNDEPTQANSIDAPAEVAGQFYPARDVDWYQFEAKQGDVYWIEVISHQLGLPVDPNFVVVRVDTNEKGEEQVKEVAFVDDPGDRAGRVASDFDTSTDDPSYRLAVPSDGVYRIRVTDQFGGSRTDPRMQYRLVLRKESPDFRVTAFAKEFKVANNNQVPVFAPTLRKGGALPIELRADRLDGFAGEVKIRVEGLPESITCAEAIFGAQQSTGSLILEAAADAPPWTGQIKLIAEAEIDGKQVTHGVPVGAVVTGTANRTQTPASFRLLNNFMLSVIGEESPATVAIGEGKVLETSLGGQLEVPVKVTRRAGHADDLKLTAIDAANEFKPADITVAKDKSDGKLTVAVKNNAKPGVYTFYLRSDTKVKYAAKPETVAQTEADQKTLDAAVKAIAEEVKQLTAKAAEAKKNATTSQAERTKAEAAAKAAQADADKAQAALKAAEDSQKKAADALAKAKEDEKEKLQAAVDTAKAAAQTAQKAAMEAGKKTSAAADAAKAAKTKSEAAAKGQAEADAALKTAQDKAKRAADAKKAADTAVANAKKAAAAKDVNLAIVSTPIRLRIASTPIEITATVAEPLKAEGKVTINVKLDKKYGFDENVDITVGYPKGVGGLTAAKLQIPKGKAEGQLELSANKSPTAGEHAVHIVAKSKFNNVNVEGAADVNVTVTVPAPEKK